MICSRGPSRTDTRGVNPPHPRGRLAPGPRPLGPQRSPTPRLTSEKLRADVDAAGQTRQSLHDRRIERDRPAGDPAELLGEQPLSPERRPGSSSQPRRGRGDPRPRGPPPARRRRPLQRPRSDRGARLRDRRLAALAAELPDLLVVMRVYFEKPRTTTGWKGLINDPHLDNSGDVNAGLRTARDLLLQVLDDGPADRLRVPRPDHPAIHRRHGRLGRDRRPDDRESDPSPARLGPVDADRLQEPHRRQRRGRRRRASAPRRPSTRSPASSSRGGSAILRTAGNDDCHIILRGGRGATNFDADSIADTLEQLRAVGLPERVIVDASHDNSGKDDERQPGRGGRDRRAGRRRQRGDRRRDARVVPRRRPPGPRRTG